MADEPGLQFDLAEFQNALTQPQCASCGGPLEDSYYEANGARVCEACGRALASEATAGPSAGRAVHAIVAGAAAAVVVPLLYYAVGPARYEFGLTAILAGYGVGLAVRWGTQRRGGRVYQALAVLLTYLSVAGTHIPSNLEQIAQDAGAPQALRRVLAAPLVAGVDNIIGPIIIGIGLYAAWMLNRPARIAITGPHAIAEAVQV